MSHDAFLLDPRLQQDTTPVASLALCDVLLMKDARYPWLILVPRVAQASETLDLSVRQRGELWAEVELAAEVLRQSLPCDKLNIGALGNIVRQLHVHVIARREGDPAWPGPVWGHSPAQAYAEAQLHERVRLLGARLRADARAL